MAVIGISTIRSEEDIIPETLPAWAHALDLVLVVDCGSTDNSAEAIREVAAHYPNVVFLGSVGPHHARQVRRHIWHRFRRHLSARDWWMVADADEFVESDFRDKIAGANAELADHIFSAHVNFYYTEEDHLLWEEGVESLADRADSIVYRRRYYQMHTTQRRAFRNLPWLSWNEDTSFPEVFSKPATERIVFRHYQYRDPIQIQSRMDIRCANDPDTDVMRENPHWKRTDYRQAISRDPNLLCWDPGTAFVATGELEEPRVPQPHWKTALKYARSLGAGAMTRQRPTDWFADIDVAAAVRRMGKRPAPKSRSVSAALTLGRAIQGDSAERGA